MSLYRTASRVLCGDDDEVMGRMMMMMMTLVMMMRMYFYSAAPCLSRFWIHLLKYVYVGLSRVAGLRGEG